MVEILKFENISLKSFGALILRKFCVEKSFSCFHSPHDWSYFIAKYLHLRLSNISDVMKSVYIFINLNLVLFQMFPQYGYMVIDDMTSRFPNIRG